MSNKNDETAQAEQKRREAEAAQAEEQKRREAEAAQAEEQKRREAEAAQAAAEKDKQAATQRRAPRTLNRPPPPRPANPAGRALPSAVVLEQDWAQFRKGKVLAANADLIATLDIERVKYRAASAREQAIGG